MAQSTGRARSWSRSCGRLSAISLAFTGDGACIGTLDRVFLDGMTLESISPLAKTIPESAVHDLPDDLRGHHGGAGRRLGRGSHALLGVSLVLRALADAGLCADRALGLGRRLPRQPACSISPAAPWCISTPASPAWSRPMCSASAAATAAKISRRYDLSLAVIGTGLLWVGWFGFNGGSALGANSRAVHRDRRDASRGQRRRLHLDGAGVVDARQAVGARHDLRRGRRARHHHAGVGLRAADGTAC